MGQILKFPVRSAKFGYKRVKRAPQENPAQLHLFQQATALVLQFTPDCSLFEQALLLDERGDARAVDFYLKAISSDDCVPDAFCNLGIIESKQGRLAKAFDCFTNCLKHNPRHFEAHYNLGNMYFEVNDFRLAKLHYEIATELDPTFPNLYFNLALVLSITKDFSAAITALEKYQEIAPPHEARNADELLETLKKSLEANQTAHLS